MNCKQCQSEMKKSHPKWGWRCTKCIKTYKLEWARQRRAKGLPAGGKRPPAEWWAKYNAEYKQRPGVRKRKAEQMKQYRQNPELRFKMVARWAVAKAIKSGKLFREACSICGEIKSQAHHTDYSKPLLVVWLCRKCHIIEHAKAEGK